MIYAMSETPVGVYRQYDARGHVNGYTLCSPTAGAHRLCGIDPELDLVPQIQVHIFDTCAEARAFREGLILAGEPEHECQRIQEGWAILRLVPYPPADEDEPAVKVVTYNDSRPRAAIYGWLDCHEERLPCGG